MCQLEGWIRAMQSHPIIGSQAVLANVLYDLQERELEGNQVICQFFQQLEESWLNGANADAFVIFCNIFKERRGDYVCQGPELPVLQQDYSRIVDVRRFVEDNLSQSRLGWWIDDEALTPWQVEMLEEVDLPAQAGQGQLRGGKPFAWVTKTAALEAIYKEHPQLTWASQVRDHLGLAHYDEGCELIEIIYQREIVMNLRIVAPIFLDGCSNSSYIKNPIYRSSSGEDGWGVTLDLNTYDNGLPGIRPRKLKKT